MAFIKVSFGLNNKFFVEDSAFKDMVKKAIKNIKNIKLIDSNITIDVSSNNFVVKIKVDITDKKTISIAAKEIQTAIESQAFALTKSKPKNIEIIFN